MSGVKTVIRMGREICIYRYIYIRRVLLSCNRRGRREGEWVGCWNSQRTLDGLDLGGKMDHGRNVHFYMGEGQVAEKSRGEGWALYSRRRVKFEN